MKREYGFPFAVYMRGVGRYHYVAQAYDGFAKCVMSCLQRSPRHRNVSSSYH